ncbi:hypothetical protein Hanom_Chr10g00917581 [Helianthus anomalus]
MICAITSLCLNLKFNFSIMIFDNKKSNLIVQTWLLYPRFIQMLINDQHLELEKQETDKMLLEHMSSITLECLESYKNK